TTLRSAVSSRCSGCPEPGRIDTVRVVGALPPARRANSRFRHPNGVSAYSGEAVTGSPIRICANQRERVPIAKERNTLDANHPICAELNHRDSVEGMDL